MKKLIALTLSLLLLLAFAGCSKKEGLVDDPGLKVPDALTVPPTTIAAPTTTDPNAPTEEPEGVHIPREAMMGIPLKDVTHTPSFYSIFVEGMPMEVIVARDSKDKVRVAFNVSYTCVGSPKAYFELQDDGTLKCANCGTQLTVDQIGAATDQCGPMAIKDFELTEQEVSISYPTLMEYRDYFTNWRTE